MVERQTTAKGEMDRTKPSRGSHPSHATCLPVPSVMAIQVHPSRVLQCAPPALRQTCTTLTVCCTVSAVQHTCFMGARRRAMLAHGAPHLSEGTSRKLPIQLVNGARAHPVIVPAGASVLRNWRSAPHLLWQDGLAGCEPLPCCAVLCRHPLLIAWSLRLVPQPSCHGLVCRHALGCSCRVRFTWLHGQACHQLHKGWRHCSQAGVRAPAAQHSQPFDSPPRPIISQSCNATAKILKAQTRWRNMHGASPKRPCDQRRPLRHKPVADPCCRSSYT